MEKQLNCSGRKKLGVSGVGLPVELMEPRRLLSAAVEHGVLSIEGTRRSDTIVLTMDSPRTMRVRVGNAESTFLRKSFSKIRIDGGMGEDLVTIGSDARPISCATSVSGGDGADTIVGGVGNDSISGGAGADLIAGAGGDDKIDGDNGADDLHGGDGRDSLCGGRGDDQLHDDAGRDSVYGNAGEDLVYFHDDVMQFRDLRKRDERFGEPAYHNPASNSPTLTVNQTPLDLVGGGHIPGGLVTVGGSTLILAGDALHQWGGAGLNVTNISAPHFDLPGNPTIAGGTLTISSSNQLVGGSGYAGSTSINSGGLSINQGGGSGLFLWPFPNFGDPGGSGTLVLSSIVLPANTVITNLSDSSTQTLQSGQTLTVVGPALITPPQGKQYQVGSGVSQQITGAANPTDTIASPPDEQSTTGDDSADSGESDDTATNDSGGDTAPTDESEPNTQTSINPASGDENTPDDGPK